MVRGNYKNSSGATSAETCSFVADWTGFSDAVPEPAPSGVVSVIGGCSTSCTLCVLVSERIPGLLGVGQTRILVGRLFGLAEFDEYFRSRGVDPLAEGLSGLAMGCERLDQLLDRAGGLVGRDSLSDVLDKRWILADTPADAEVDRFNQIGDSDWLAYERTRAYFEEYLIYFKKTSLSEQL